MAGARANFDDSDDELDVDVGVFFKHLAEEHPRVTANIVTTLACADLRRLSSSVNAVEESKALFVARDGRNERFVSLPKRFELTNF